MRRMMTIGSLLLATACGPSDLSGQPEPRLAPCAAPRPAWVWCDDFEADRLGQYFEYASAGGQFVRTAGAGRGGSVGMRGAFRKGQVDAGFLHLAFGRTPQGYFRPVDGGDREYRELWFRFHIYYEPGWVGGGGNKIARLFSFASPTHWGQAMIAHLWSGGDGDRQLVLDPARGTDASGRLVTTRYNDFDHLTWLGAMRTGPIFDGRQVGRWTCLEARVRLNTPGARDGVFEVWVDGLRSAGRTDLDWVGTFQGVGLNAFYLENYWNEGSAGDQARVFDDLVISTAPIGCN